jgi:hypothetical protein
MIAAQAGQQPGELVPQHVERESSWPAASPLA